MPRVIAVTGVTGTLGRRVAERLAAAGTDAELRLVVRDPARAPDLPGGDGSAMQRSLRDVVLPLADSTLVLPGHGSATTMRRERGTNPYLRGLGA